MLVSVLDLDKIAFGPKALDPPYSENPAILMLISLNDVKSRPIGRASTRKKCLPVKSRAMVGRARVPRSLIEARTRNKELRRDPPFARQMVGRGGLEPPTSRLSGVRSNHLSYRPIWWNAPVGGACRDRTDDPLLAKQVLSQLS
jgi:hypothetical protein